MSGIVLSAGVRSNLLQLQQTSDLITTTQTRLATGKRVNSALDNPNNYFTAQGLDNRANDLSNLLNSQSSAINTIQAANNGISAITKLVQSAQSLTSQAQQTTDTAVRATLSSQFTALLTQIGQLASDSGFNGINLLGGDTLTVKLDETGNSSVAVTGVTYTNANSAPLSIATRQQLGRQHRYHGGLDRPDRRAHHAAFEVADPRLEPVGRADPSGLHQGDDQHPANRLERPHPRRFQPGRRQPARLADPSATVDHRAVSRLAGRPERAQALPVRLNARHERNGGLRAAVFFLRV